MSPSVSNIISETISGVQVDYKIPSGSGPFPLIILLHGWTGDEKSMWIFTSRLPKDWIYMAPRGLFSSSLGGFSWFPDSAGQWPEIDDFMPAIDALNTIIDSKAIRNRQDDQGIRLVGFSQGAALAYSFSIHPPVRVRSIAGLSGFVPNGIQEFIYEKPLAEIPIFVTHGIQDKIVSIERGRNGVAILQELGAAVTYCEEESGHRLSPNCFRGLQTFFQSF